MARSLFPISLELCFHVDAENNDFFFLKGANFQCLNKQMLRFQKSPTHFKIQLDNESNTGSIR